MKKSEEIRDLVIQAVARVVNERMSPEERRFLNLAVQRLITPYSTKEYASPSDGQVNAAWKAAQHARLNIRAHDAALACYWADSAHYRPHAARRAAGRVV